MTSRLYKFLRAGAIGRFSRARWPVPAARGRSGAETSVELPLDPCARGLHVCRAADLPYWLDDELWLVETAGEQLEVARKVVVERARLRERVVGWPEPAAHDLAVDAVRRVRDLAAAELELAGLATDGLRAAEENAAVAEVAAALARTVGPMTPTPVAWFVGFLTDAVDELRHPPVQAAIGATYVAAYASDRSSAPHDVPIPAGSSPFEVERQRQADALVRLLDLS